MSFSRIGPPPAAYYPRDREGVLNIAQSWHEPHLVAVDLEKIKQIPKGEIQSPDSTQISLDIAQQTPLTDATEFAIAMGAINHMFWALDDKGQFVRYEHSGRTGALAMSHAFEQAWQDRNSPIRRAIDYSEPLTLDGIHAVFGAIPDPEGRRQILNEILLSYELAAVGEQVENMAQKGHVFDTSFAAQLADLFPLGYADEVLKKAQLATSVIWRSARVRGYVCPPCSLTAFADYQIPNVMRALGILTYSPGLAQKIDAGHLIQANSIEEEAIRGASILAIEALSQAQDVAVADVDYWIWLKRKEPQTPFHLTLTTYY